MRGWGSAAAALAAALVVTVAPLRAPPGAEEGPLEVVEVRLDGGGRAGALPVVVAIHGLGGRPETFASIFDGFALRARLVLPRAPRPWGPGFAWMPGQTHPGRAAAERRSADLVAGLIRRIPGTEATGGRVVVTGFSQGGVLAFLVAARHPDLVQAAIPVSGYLPESAAPPRRREGRWLPAVRAIHGTEDRVLGILGARRSIARLRRLGWDAELREHEGVGHELSAAMLGDLEARLAELLPCALEPDARRR